MSSKEDVIIAEKEFNRMKSVHQKSGYREGSFEGMENTTQKGFNNGFKEGVTISLEWGKLIGEISAYKSYYEAQSRRRTDRLVASLQALKNEAEELKKDQHITTTTSLREKLNKLLPRPL